jgi:hypothetical protein
MNERQEYFNIEINQNGYILYANERDRVYIPTTKDEFNKFVDAIYSMIDSPTEEQERNYKIFKQYPFLLPKNRWDRGFSLSDSSFMFSYTELDAMPRPWIADFGWNMVQEIKDALVQEDEGLLYQYTITDIKDKFGGLRWYDRGYTPAVGEIIAKYERRSYEVDINTISEAAMQQYKEAYQKLADGPLVSTGRAIGS